MVRFGCLGPPKKANFSQNWKKQKKIFLTPIFRVLDLLFWDPWGPRGPIDPI
jgi:hypothetical protein